jgi:hypothetical protein
VFVRLKDMAGRFDHQTHQERPFRKAEKKTVRCRLFTPSKPGALFGQASLGVDEDWEMAATKFTVNDRVRLIGTDTIQTVRQYNAETLEYQVQWGNNAASLVWVPEIYLELVEPTSLG